MIATLSVSLLPKQRAVSPLLRSPQGSGGRQSGAGSGLLEGVRVAERWGLHGQPATFRPPNGHAAMGHVRLPHPGSLLGVSF